MLHRCCSQSESFVAAGEAASATVAAEQPGPQGGHEVEDDHAHGRLREVQAEPERQLKCRHHEDDPPHADTQADELVGAVGSPPKRHERHRHHDDPDDCQHLILLSRDGIEHRTVSNRIMLYHIIPICVKCLIIRESVSFYSRSADKR